jgi:hypothetical protein
MKRSILVFALLALAPFAFAQRIDETNGKHTQLYPTKERASGRAKPGGGSNLSFHGGPTITNAKSVAIFWGSAWSSNGRSLDDPAALELLGFFSQFGGTGEYKVITQYSGIQPASLTNNFWWDPSDPPTNVTDSALVAEVVKYLDGHGADTSTIYSVFLPSTSYSSFGTSDSCGGPHLVFCAYHSNFSYGTPAKDIKYSSLPYPSCGGCQWTGFTVAQNFEHFACHETREAVTDPDGNAWFDRRGNEADDKCAWSPAPFLGTGGYGYQWEWSNAVSGCVQTAP